MGPPPCRSGSSARQSPSSTGPALAARGPCRWRYSSSIWTASGCRRRRRCGGAVGLRRTTMLAARTPAVQSRLGQRGRRAGAPRQRLRRRRAGRAGARRARRRRWACGCRRSRRPPRRACCSCWRRRSSRRPPRWWRAAAGAARGPRWAAAGAAAAPAWGTARLGGSAPGKGAAAGGALQAAAIL